MAMEHSQLIRRNSQELKSHANKSRGIVPNIFNHLWVDLYDLDNLGVPLTEGPTPSPVVPTFPPHLR